MDGKASSMGLNVYETTPWETYKLCLEHDHTCGVDMNHLHSIFEKTGFKNYYTIYPPTLQLILWGSSEFFPLSQRGLKLILYIFFLGSLFLIYQIYSNDKHLKKWIPTALLLPLFLWEGVGAAHSEVLFVFFLFLTLFCSYKKYFFWTGVSLSLLTWIKFFPAVLGVVFLSWIIMNASIKKALLFILGGMLTTIFVWLPFLWFSPEHFFNALELYSSEWRMFPLIFDILEKNFSLQIAQFIQVFGTIGVAIFVLWKRYQLDEQVFWIFFTYLILSPVIFSWYFLWISVLGVFVLARKKFYILLFGILITPCIQHFFTIWDKENQIFYYEENGLGWEVKIWFWGILMLCVVLEYLRYIHTQKYLK